MAIIRKIQVKPGNRMPGIPLHNLNFNFAYDVTNKWRVGLNAVMHSEAFLRGNENNKHKAGPASASGFMPSSSQQGNALSFSCRFWLKAKHRVIPCLTSRPVIN